MTDKTQKATKVKCKHGHTCDESTTKRWIFLEFIFFGKKSIWAVLELVHSKTQNFTIIDQEKHKIKKIYIILETHDYQTYYVNIDLCHQYGISVAEKQTFLLAKHPSQRQGAKRNSCVCRLHFPLPHTTHKYDRSVPETTTSTLLPQPINSTNFINFLWVIDLL